MVILSINRAFFWSMGERTGVPSVYLPMKGLVDAGHKMHYLYPDYAPNKNPELIDGIYVHRFRLLFGLTREESVSKEFVKTGTERLFRSILGNLRWLFFNVFGVIEGFKIARREQANLIYAHTEQTALIAYVLSRLLSIPFIVRIYGLGGLYRELNRLSTKIKYFRTLLAFKVPADYFIIVKDGTDSYLVAKKMGVPQDKIAHWRNGVDFNIYNPDPELKSRVLRQLSLESNQRIILWVSRLASDKGAHKLISCLPALFKKEQKSVCIMVGDGYEKDRLKKMCRDSGIQERVIFTGYLPRDRVADLHNASDILVALCDYGNCSNVLWEAMACAKCIVSLDDNEGTREVIKSGYNGILISPQELDRLDEILFGLLNNDRQRKELGMNARKTVEGLLESWDSRIKREIDLIEKLVDSHLQAKNNRENDKAKTGQSL